MIAKANIYAVVVWYNPTPEQCDSIRSFMNEVKQVVIVDNSPQDNSSLAALLPEDRYFYLPQMTNKGVATALNIGCCYALEQGAEWIMTMDQDSVWEKDQLARYIEYAGAYPDISQVGVFSPRQAYGTEHKVFTERYEEKLAVMTSGCLLSAGGFKATGGFLDELFIDEVDNEYCLHIHRLGMKVVVINHCLLQHHLGDVQTTRVLGIWRKTYIRHAPFRYYYMVRNALYLRDRYPEYRTFFTKRIRKTIKRILLYHRRHKLEALRMCRLGWKDYKNHRMNQYNH